MCTDLRLKTVDKGLISVSSGLFPNAFILYLDRQEHFIAAEGVELHDAVIYPAALNFFQSGIVLLTTG